MSENRINSFRLGPSEEGHIGMIGGPVVGDLSPEESNESCKPAIKAGLNLARLASPTINDVRLPAILANTSRFVYDISAIRITGTRAASIDPVSVAVDHHRRHTELPAAVGFGIKTLNQAAEIARVADGAVIESKFVDTLSSTLDDKGRATKETVPE